MRRLVYILSFLLIFTSISLPVVVCADTAYWKVDMSVPSTQSSKSFNIQYTALSTNSADNITVDLYQNDVVVGSQTTSKPYGDSGTFAVAVPSEGVYNFKIQATNGSSVKYTDNKQVNVTSPTTIINKVNDGSNQSSSSNTNLSGAESGLYGNGEGQVNADGSSSTKKSDQTLGESKKSDSSSSTKTAGKKGSVIAWVVIVMIITLVVIYANRSRLFGKNKQD